MMRACEATCPVQLFVLARFDNCIITTIIIVIVMAYVIIIQVVVVVEIVTIQNCKNSFTGTIAAHASHRGSTT